MGLLGNQIYRRQLQALRRFIDLDPIELTIRRTLRRRDEEGFVEEKLLVGPYRCRLVPVRGQATGPRISQKEYAGAIYTDIFYELVAEATADLRAGAHVRDEFVVDEGRFQINRVHYLRAGGRVYGYQCELERIDS